ncbi:MAG: hypothetical protein HYU28_12570 [Actinobacteria bacterium]|nr:hypothetical protein [Actinomycetota bacterium]
MGSSVAWLDASPEEQRRVREVVQLFSQRETQDELGGRRIVVTLADALFPGTSVLHSRARYLLFIPWFCQVAAQKRQPLKALDTLERRLIGRFIEEGHVEGLIGRDAGVNVKQLPSSAYWTALEAWGIRQWPGDLATTLDRSRASGGEDGDDVDELAHRAPSVWHPEVGTSPVGFPDDTVDGGFSLKRGEASWLQERWLATTDGSLLAHLAKTLAPLSEVPSAPWDEPACATAPPEVRAVLNDAERFAFALDGSRMLYHLLVAEAYKDSGHTMIEVELDWYRSPLDDWAEEVDRRAELFAGWDSNAFWADVRLRNPRIDELSRRFFDVWFDRIHRQEVAAIADDAKLRALVVDRERFLKRSQGRLVNQKLLGGWRGGTSGRANFRWPQVHRLVSDVITGLEGG